MDSDSEWKLRKLITQVLSLDATDSDNVLGIMQVISFVISMYLESQLKPKPESESESELMSLVTQAISVFNSMDLDFQPEPLPEFISLITEKLSLVNSMDLVSDADQDSEFLSLFDITLNLEPKPELISIIVKISSLFVDMESISLVAQSVSPNSDEWKLASLLSQLNSYLLFFADTKTYEWMPNGISFMSIISQLISFVSQLDLDSQAKPQTQVMSFVTQIIKVANSISDPGPELEFITFVTEMISQIRSKDRKHESLVILIGRLSSFFSTLDPVASELSSLINQLIYLADSTILGTEDKREHDRLVSLSPQLKVQLVQGKFHVKGKVQQKNKEKGKCQAKNLKKFYLARGVYATHFRCKNCNGEDHEECESKVPVEVKHPLHPKHHLQLVVQKSSMQTRKCFCCDEDLHKCFYYCLACDYAMNIACAEKQPVLYIDHPKWHEHTLALFPRQAFLTCNVCALADASSPIYMCPPCDFVVHLRCMILPRVIRISRHSHRISFTPSFTQGDWSCGVCRKNIDNDYGSYSCIKDGCLYAAHSRCATQKNVWDGIDLEGVPEEIEEEVEPFVRISDGVIQHFSHQHILGLHENMGGNYNNNKRCHACLTPIDLGNFYSCMTCDFILHEECANLSRKIYHPIHPHMLTLAAGYVGLIDHDHGLCSACPWLCTTGFFYECSKARCIFKLHVQCATISEPLVHGSHTHPLFLTSKPEEERVCYLCGWTSKYSAIETLNCIEECDFALCFKCVTLPQKVRYKHDNKHLLTIYYGKETSSMIYWCEACEKKINPKGRFYKCDEKNCCVTLHIECLVGKDLYYKPGPSYLIYGKKFVGLPNNHMSRSICLNCKKRCPYEIVFEHSGSIFCSTHCIADFYVYFSKE